MNRKEFMKYGAMGVAGMVMFPADLLAKETKAANENRFPKPLPFTKKGEWKEFEISIRINEQELAPDMKIHTLAFNDTVPGPELRVKQGDKVRVIFKNNSGLNHTIHWHGIHVPWRMDGVPYVTQMPVMSGRNLSMNLLLNPTEPIFITVTGERCCTCSQECSEA